MKVLVLGGTGFAGRHAAAALAARGHAVALGTRQPGRAARRLPAALAACQRREIHLDWIAAAAGWKPHLAGLDAVVNCAGILRERGFETYERVHYQGVRALAEACACLGLRLVHLSPLGLATDTRTLFGRSKLAGEFAVMRSRADWTVVRAPLLDGPGGHAARWLRRLARWPILPVPAHARAPIAALDVRDLGEAVAVLCERPGADWREVELGGPARHTLAEHIGALRALDGGAGVPTLRVPQALAQLAAHACDALHLGALSAGTLELACRGMAPRMNLAPALLGRAPAAVGAAVRQPSAATPAGQEIPVPPSPQ